MAITNLGTMTLDELVVSGRSALYTKGVKFMKVVNAATLNRGQLVGYAVDADNVTEASTMPAAGATYLGKFYRFTGVTGTYTNGNYYECTVASEVYSWTERAEKDVPHACKAMATGAEVYGILADDVDLSTTAQVDGLIYVSGNFNGNKIVGYEDKYYNDLRDKGIFVEKAFTY